MQPAEVKLQRSSLASRTADEAWDVLSRMYTDARPLMSSPSARIQFHTVATSELAVDRGWLSAAAGAFDPSPEQLNLISVLDGRISLNFGHREAITSRGGDSYVYLPDSPGAQLEWDAFQALTVRLPMAVIERVAAELVGLNPTELRFSSARPLTAAHRRMWLRTAATLWQALSDPDSPATHPLVHRELVDLAATAALSAFPNTTLCHRSADTRGGVTGRTLRRAIAYIEEHAALPITLTDIADAAGTTPASLRTAFRRGLDTTPTAYLRRVRREVAASELRDVDPADVEEARRVVTCWGFIDPARLRAERPSTLGDPPDDTGARP